MHLPTLSDFAGDQFVKNHCFRYAGLEKTGEGSAVRIDFRAADKRGARDVKGTILLDSASYQVRRAARRVSHGPSALTKVAAENVTTLFKHTEPSVRAFSELDG